MAMDLNDPELEFSDLVYAYQSWVMAVINDEKLSEAYLEAAKDIVGKENISGTQEPATGSEDFADMINVVPGAYCRIGHSGTTGLHNPSFFLDPDVLPIGASVMARIVERRLPACTRRERYK